MNRRSITRSLVAAIAMAPFAVSAATLADAGTCPNDSKLLNGGPTMIDGDGPGTWWGLILGGLLAAGFTEEQDQIDYLNKIFNTDFATLDELRTFNLDSVRDAWDLNGNGFVCAYELRGTRAHFDNPLLNVTFFGISDDKVPKK